MGKGKAAAAADVVAEPIVLPVLTGTAAGQPIEKLTGVGAQRGKSLREAGIGTVGDLLLRLPRRYLDRSRIVSVEDAPVGEEITLLVRVQKAPAPTRFRRGGRQPPREVVVEDDSGTLRCVWFRGGHFHNFEAGDLLALSGRLEVYRQQRQMSHPEYEFVSAGDEEELEPGELLHTGGIIPLYASSAELTERGLRSRGFRRLVRGALSLVRSDLHSAIDESVAAGHGLPTLQVALQQVHFPQSRDQAEAGRRRLALEELYHLQREFAARRRLRLSRPIESMPLSERLVPRLLDQLDFTLTGAQQRVVSQIAADLQQSRPMRRLLHGDVGSGKTLVALCAALQAMDAGFQVAVMAPTEILADQHFQNWQRLLAPLGLSPALLKGGQRAVVRRELLNGLLTGGLNLIVGTHALLQEEVQFSRLGLVVVDEQHRFGVAQREQLTAKSASVHTLVMTATPIPRSLALSLYGDLDVSVLDELPPGRQPVRTALRSADRRDRIFEFVTEQVAAGRQAYVVYPTIEESKETGLLSAEAAHAELSAGPLSECRVELIHGRLPTDQKTTVMARFVAGEVDVLISTTVIEVGVDVANATVMVIEHAERFGLAQLHQLRGRVGRGGEASYCILVAHPLEGEGQLWRERLDALCATNDGFELARKDLELRGPGELLGTRQAGLPELRIAHLLRDEDLLEVARTAAMPEESA
jgi:ATP-dependent DNA helicase RecG